MLCLVLLLLSVDGWERSIHLVCQIHHMLCIQSPYSMPSHNDEASLWSTVPNHSCQWTQSQTVSRPCKAICLGRLTQLLPLSLLRKSESHNAPLGSVLLGTALRSHGEGGFAPTNCHKTIRHSTSTGSCWLEPVRRDSTRESGGSVPVSSLASTCADVWILPKKYLPRKSIIFCILSYGGRAAFVISFGRCCWVWIWASAYPQEIFQSVYWKDLVSRRLQLVTFFTVRRNYHRKGNAEPEHDLQWVLLFYICEWARTNGDFPAVISRRGHIF